MTDTFDGLLNFIKHRFGDLESVYLHEPQFIGNEKKYLNDTVDSTFVSSVGPYVDRFEREFSLLTESEGTVAVVNGTSALEVALRLSGVLPGDEVITQALTFVATANAISYNQAKPVFVDVDIKTMGLCPDALSSFLDVFGELRDGHCYNKDTGNRISACVPMHTFGFMCRMDEIVRVCDKWNLKVVEDAAEALGSKFRGKSAGSFGQLAAFSFNGNKIITGGGGGAIVAQNPSLIQQGKYLTTTAKRPHPWEYFHDELGYNYRMPNLNAALLCGQMEQLSRLIVGKKKLFNDYSEYLTGSSVELLTPPEGSEWNHWLMSVRLNSFAERDDFLKLTNSKNVHTRPIWKLLFKLPMYEACVRDSQKNAIALENTVVCIPSSPRL